MLTMKYLLTEHPDRLFPGFLWIINFPSVHAMRERIVSRSYLLMVQIHMPSRTLIMRRTPSLSQYLESSLKLVQL